MRAAGRGYNTAQAPSRASVVPDPRQFRSQIPVVRRSAPCAAALNLPTTTNPAARRKASSVHVHVTAARPQTRTQVCPRLLGIEECPHYATAGFFASDIE